MHTPTLLGITTLVAALCAAPLAAAQGVSVATRESIQRGNFAVGYATLGDAGNALQTFTTPDAAFSNTVGDSGGVEGVVSGLPVAGTGSFHSALSYDVAAALVSFGGEAATTVSTPYSHVSVGASALSQLDLLLQLAAPMAFELRVELIEVPGATVNGLTAQADTLVKLSGPGDSWLYGAPGSFVQAGVLDAGLWRINAFADARGNGSAAFIGTLTIAPVPEPASVGLMLLGVAALIAHRRRRLADGG